MIQAAWERICPWRAQARNPEPMSDAGHRLLTLGGQAWPTESETLHLLVAGTTDSGKSTLIEELLDGIRTHGELMR